uniref:60S ribosomal protein L41 n=1 Tax=Albugo laibachii Nc14 TaxID=890382 RepID=F0W621_9STRA|nr:conserved hypothetical protein [Albugo laibachii Nc14]|eukprot:CCA16563.1 conserved hypothetical protein [Albugo laibachii Nc14]
MSTLRIRAWRLIACFFTPQLEYTKQLFSTSPIAGSLGLASGYILKHLSIQEDQQIMQIFIHTLSGAQQSLSVEHDASVESVKQWIENTESISDFRLVCAGKQLEKGLLSNYGVEDADTLKVLLRLPGGMRGKWRKKRTRRLRRKRRKMRQRAR